MTKKTFLIFSFFLFLSSSCLERTSKIALKTVGVTAARIGNTNSDYCNGVTVDSSGNIYCAGVTYGVMGEANGGSSDAFIVKFNSSGTLQWVKQLGAVTTAAGNNAGNDYCKGITVDSSGNVYCAGYTDGSIGEANGGGTDTFIMKLNSSGALQWIKQLGAVTTAPGGSNAGNDYCYGVTVDSADNVYCAGFTDGAMGEANGGGSDAFIMKLNSSGALQWVTQLGAVTTAAGGSNAGNDYCKGVNVDSAGNVYCAGATYGAMGEANGGNTDAFIMKLNSSGALQWVTQLGAVTTAAGGSNAGTDHCTGVTVDSANNIYCAGVTDGAMGEVNGGGSYDAFIMKLNSSGALQWVTQLGAGTTAAGGNNGATEECTSVTVDSANNVYCAGYTDGSMGEANGGGNDTFIMKLNSGGALQWIKQLGAVTTAAGSNADNDYCNGVAIDSADNVYCTGGTYGAMGETNGGNTDAFVMKLNSSGTLQWVKQLGAITKAI